MMIIRTITLRDQTASRGDLLRFSSSVRLRYWTTREGEHGNDDTADKQKHAQDPAENECGGGQVRGKPEINVARNTRESGCSYGADSMARSSQLVQLGC
jgi:hypothetical protein